MDESNNENSEWNTISRNVHNVSIYLFIFTLKIKILFINTELFEDIFCRNGSDYLFCLNTGYIQRETKRLSSAGSSLKTFFS